jgi:glycosyltransferase involved in cell wall biosynthesis
VLFLSRLDVLIVCTGLREADPSYRRLSYFAKYLKLKGLRVACAGFLQLSGRGLVEVSSECYKLPFRVLTQSSVLNLLFNALSTVTMLLSLVLTILVLKPRVVIVSTPSSHPVLPAYLGCALSRSKLIIDVRDPHEELLVYKARRGVLRLLAEIYRRVNYSVYRRASGVLAVTRSLATLLASRTGRRVYIAPNGADLEVFKPVDKKTAREKFKLPPGALLVAYSGVLSSRGYYDIVPVLEAIRRLRRRGVDVRVLATGPIRDERVKEVFRVFRDEITHLGVLPLGDYIAAMSACDVGVVPRVGDHVYDYSIPVKLYEYVALGLPVVVTANKSSELARLVEENSLGFVCEPGDALCLERVIGELASNRSLLSKLRENALSHRARVDRRIGAEKLCELVVSALRDSR